VFKTKLEWRGRDGLNDEKLHILFKRRNAHKKVICRAKTSEKVSFFGSSLSLVLVAGMSLYATKTKLSDCRLKLLILQSYAGNFFLFAFPPGVCCTEPNGACAKK